MNIPYTTKDFEDKSYLQIMDMMRPYIPCPPKISYDEFIGYLFNLFKISGFSPSTEQLYALLISRTQPTLIDACPGSGKTTLTQTLTLIDEFIYDIEPSRIYCVTFSRKASIDMIKRHRELKKPFGIDTEVEVNTIHALCRKYIKKYYRECGLRSFQDRDDCSTIMEEEQSFSMFYNLYKAVIKDRNQQHAKDMYACNSYKVAYNLTDEELVNTPQFSSLRIEWTKYNNIVEAYNNAKQVSDKLDFDDLQITFLELLKNYPEIRKIIQNEWDRWIIDEYQDTSIVQKDILKYIVRDEDYLVTVGDGDQTIYSWRGANPYGCVNFTKDYPRAKVVTLTINHRCPQEIVKPASILINHNLIRNEKDMVSVKEGGSLETVPVRSNYEACNVIAEDIKKWLDEGGKREDLKDIAVIFRNNYHPTALIDMLLKYDIPMNITSGILPYKDRIVTDFYNIISLAQDTSNEYYLPHLFKIFPSVQKKHIKAIISQVKEGRKLEDVRVQGIPYKQYERDCEEFAKLVELTSSRRTPVRELATVFVPMYQRAYYASVSDFLGIEEAHSQLIFGYLLNQPKEVHFNRFLQTIQDYNDKLARYKKLGGGIFISTFHGVKGLEFKQVYMLGIDRSFPNMDKTIHMTPKGIQEFVEEERRLFYVGLTRTLDKCKIVYDSFKPSVFMTELGLGGDLSPLEDTIYDIDLGEGKEEIVINKTPKIDLLLGGNKPSIVDNTDELEGNLTLDFPEDIEEDFESYLDLPKDYLDILANIE